jgi:signal transduction histidine kinase
MPLDRQFVPKTIRPGRCVFHPIDALPGLSTRFRPPLRRTAREGSSVIRTNDMTWGILPIAASAWAAVALLALATAHLTGAAPFPFGIPWATLVATEVVSLTIWTAATPAALWTARQLVPGGARRVLAAAVQVSAGLIFVLAGAEAERWVVAQLVAPEQLPALSAILPRFDARVLGYLMIATLTQATRYVALYRERELQTAGLETRLAKTKLQVLKMQLQPHFLFNTLNTTAELVHADPNAADRMITRLGDFLRLSLDHAGHLLVPFRQEIDFIRAYVDIEQVRWGDRLTVEWDCDPDTLDAAVPTLAWQPVLENAIRHGRDPRSGRARIHLGSRRQGSHVLLFIRDWGPGLPEAGPRENVGLRNTRERVERLYGRNARFDLANATGGGAIATLLLPYTPCAAAHTPLPLRTIELGEPA